MQKIKYFLDFYNTTLENYIENLIPDDAVFDDFMQKAIAVKTEAAYYDAKNLGLSNEDIYTILTIETRSVCYDVTIDSGKVNELLNKMFSNEQLCQSIINVKDFSSDFFSCLKRIIPLYNKLRQFEKQNKSLDVLREYKNLFNLIAAETLSLTDSVESVQAELNKMYPISNKNHYNTYKARQKNRRYKSATSTNLIIDNGVINSSYVCSVLRDYFYHEMLKFYERTGYYYRTINDDFSIYILNRITFITYAFDDSIDVYIKNFDKEYDLSNYKFWAKVNTVNFNILDNLISIRGLPKVDGIICPDEYLVTALFLYLKNEGLEKNEITNFLQSISSENVVDINNLISLKSGGFIKNYQKPDILSMKVIERYPHLIKLLNYQGKERENYIKRLIAKFKGDLNRELKESYNKPNNYNSNRYSSRNKGSKNYID